MMDRGATHHGEKGGLGQRSKIKDQVSSEKVVS